MLYQRVLTAIIVGAAFLVVVFFGGKWFLVSIALLGILAFFELLQMKGYKFYEIPSLAGFLLMETWLLYGANWLTLNQSSILLWIVYAFLFMTVVMKNRYAFQDMSHIFVGSIYIGLSLHYVLQLRAMQEGLVLFIFVLFVIWATDIGAFFVGRFVKGPKIWPSISPNKTVSGTVGGLLAAALIGTVFFIFFPIGHSPSQWLILSLAISVTGQAGDFVESGIKRSLDVKDSGLILPGHGGVLDRFDSLLFAAPIAYHLLVFGLHF